MHTVDVSEAFAETPCDECVADRFDEGGVREAVVSITIEGKERALCRIHSHQLREQIEEMEPVQ